jgi:hypothetical protein
MERKLAAILCADVFGYSRLMGDDEEATLRTLTPHRKLIAGVIVYRSLPVSSSTTRMIRIIPPILRPPVGP